MSSKQQSLAKSQMSKHIQKRLKPVGGNPASTKPGGQQKNMTKIGQATAKRMRDKAANGEKRRPKGFDEEIDSDIAEDIDEQDHEMANEEKRKTRMGIQNDAFFDNPDNMEKNETIEERRLRMTKQLLEELQQPSTVKDDFFESLQAGTGKVDAEVDIFNEKEDDLLTRRLKYQILEKKGKLFYNIADHFTSGELQTVFLKGHKKAITALEWSQDNRSVFTASKDCCLIQWDLESQKKLLFKGEKHNRAIDGHFDEPLCIATNGKYLVSGGKDRVVRIWDIHNQKQIQSFIGHRDTITSIKFDRENDQFYTVSNDRCLKVWNIREMAYMDSHYGHHSDILGLDTYSQDRLLSCGLDRQVIFWKINEDSELIYKNEKHTTDTINVINNQYFLTGSVDNSIDLWIMNKKRPMFTMENLHNNDSWLLSTANVRNSDLFCSGSYDGQVIFYKLNKDKKNFEIARKLNGLNGCLNQMRFSNVRGQDFSNLMLAVSHSKEERTGRWHVQPKVKDGITIIRRTGGQSE